MTSDARALAWATRREKYGTRGHSGSYRRGAYRVDLTGARALGLVIRLHREGTLSEGQCCTALNMDRIDFRHMVDGWDDGFLPQASKGSETDG